MSAISISFDPSHNPEVPTMVLMKKNGEMLGQIDAKSVITKDQFTNASEITFSVKKYVDGKISPLWDKIVDFKLVLCVEWKTVFEIKVDVAESIETTKTVYGTELAQSELSQIMLFNNEYNTETDISRDDYENPTVLYKPSKPSESLLHRMLEKAPHYKILYVDSSIRNIQRTFSFDNVSLYDAFTQVGEEINCVFLYDSSIDADGNIVRGISVYDLETVCNSCGHRGDYIGICPECGGTNLKEGYGEDTTIFVTSDELASNIQLSTDVGSVKNCFKLEAGDDLMTATIRNCNPNGSDYLWYISDALKVDMSDRLVKRIESYDTLYAEYQKSHVYSLNSSKIAEYNAIIRKYLPFDSKLELITTPVVSYPTLMNIYYNTIDLALYLESALMPDAKLSDTTAREQLSKLTNANLSPCAVTELNYMSSATADNVVMQMAKALTDARYKIEIIGSSLTNNSTFYTWTGVFKVTNYYDAEDTATGTSVQVVINDDYQAYIMQKMTAALHEKDTTDLSITGLFDMSDTNFKAELKKYALNRLLSFQSACQACLDILIEQGISTSSTWAGKTPNLYDGIYTPYYNRLGFIEAEIKIRENELSVIKGKEDEDGKVLIKGLQHFILELVEATQRALDFEKYIGTELWKEFITFRRESKFSNTNYVSDGLDNAQLFQNAREFIKVAEKEIFKSAERQHSITTTLKNLLIMKKFQPIVNSFKVGNWLRIQIDDDVYKLRLLKYEIDFDNLENTNVEFSDVFKTMDGLSDQQSLIQKTTQMATSYNTTQRQASKGAESQVMVASWQENGIDSSSTRIVNETSSGQDQTWDEHGMLFRRKNFYTGDYDDIQMKIINSTLSITDDNWKSTKTAVGLFKYQDPRDGQIKSAYGINGELIIGRLLVGEGLGLYNEAGNLTFDERGFIVTNNVNTVVINPNASSLFTVRNKNGEVISMDSEGNGVFSGKIVANSGLLGNWNVTRYNLFAQFSTQSTQWVKRPVTDEHGNFMYETEYLFDRNGKPIYVTDDDGNIVYETQYVYDESGNLVYKTDVDGNIIYVDEPVYNETFNENGELVREPVYTYQLDEEGNIVYTEDYEYCDKVDENGELVYDDEGNVEREIVYTEQLDEDGNIVYEEKPVYDDEGNPVIDYEYDEDGEIISETPRTEQVPVMIPKIIRTPVSIPLVQKVPVYESIQVPVQKTEQKLIYEDVEEIIDNFYNTYTTMCASSDSDTDSDSDIGIAVGCSSVNPDGIPVASTGSIRLYNNGQLHSKQYWVDNGSNEPSMNFQRVRSNGEKTVSKMYSWDSDVPAFAFAFRATTRGNFVYSTMINKDGIQPYATNNYYCGTPSYRWGYVYTKNFDAIGTVSLPYTVNMKDDLNRSRTVLYLYNDGSSNYGSNLLMQGGGNLFLGSGESATALYQAAYKNSNTEHLFLSSDSNIYLYTNCQTIGSRVGIVLDTSLNFRPLTNAVGNLGSSSYRWNNIYSAHSVSVSSDARLKEDVQEIHKAKELIMAIEPVQYLLKGRDSDRYHYGFISQQFKQAMTKVGIDDCGAWTVDITSEGVMNGHDIHTATEDEKIYGLRYEELIAPMVKVLQDLNTRLNKIEKKLGI